jgi:putative heme iron utilization protein
MLAEMGAEVLRVERLGGTRDFLNLPKQFDLDRHGRSIVRVDLKRPEGVALLLDLAEKADVLIEGFRPGVMERFGLGPEEMQARNPALIYGRMTGFGQDGPMKDRAGHDITYLAHSGVLHAIGEKGGRPIPPLNLAADYGGGTMFLIMGVLAALFERARSGRGQVVDAAMIDGAAMLAAPFFGFMASGIWRDERGSNLLDTGAPFYDTYETSDGKHIAVGCLEPQFFAEFARLLPLEERLAQRQYDISLWDEMRAAIAARIKEKTRGRMGCGLRGHGRLRCAGALIHRGASAPAQPRPRHLHRQGRADATRARAALLAYAIGSGRSDRGSAAGRAGAFRHRTGNGVRIDRTRRDRAQVTAMAEKKDVIRPTDEEAIRLARSLMRAARHGALAVLDPETGAPQASRVAVATDLDGTPIILVSSLSGHTPGLIADRRCSLLVGEPGKGDPLAHPRITVSCEAERVERGTKAHGRIARRFLNRHPKAKLYADFGDFSYFLLHPKSASLNGGFGKAYRLTAPELLADEAVARDLADIEQGALDHMNADHRDAIAHYAAHFGKAKPGDWHMTGIDPDGIDLALGDQALRIAYPEPLAEAAQMRKVLVDMAAACRAALGE